MSRPRALVLAVTVLAACDMAKVPEGAVGTTGTFVDTGTVPFAVPALATIPDGPMGAAVRRGRALLEATRDSLPRLVGNDLRCTSCHLDGGTREHVMPWVGVYARFPQYRPRSGAVIDLEERIGDCFERSLNGRAPAHASREMRDMVSYMAWLSREVPVGRELAGQGMPSVAPLVPDTASGRALFAAECARCHGAEGEGGVVPPAPALWGPRSYNIGAGMARLRTAAAFIRVAMPFDRPGTLTDQQAYDVAGYMNSRPRPDHAGKERDWPHGDPPPDVAYPTTAGRRAVQP